MRVRLAIGTLVSFFVLLALCFYLIPEHWLRHMPKFATVTVNGHRVEAESYLGQTTNNEADAFLLVKMDGGWYLFNFEDEKYREASANEFLRLPWGVFSFRRMSRGPWYEPLPAHDMNEFSIRSSAGKLIVVKF